MQQCDSKLVACRPLFLTPYHSKRAPMAELELKRRTTHRFSFYAPAELLSADATELTAVPSLSLYGCYLEPTGHHPPGTPVTVKIFCGGQSFEAAAKVLYVLPPNQG